MNVRCGTDATTISRLEQAISRQGDRFLKHVFTDAETAYCQSRGRQTYASFAVRFAAKEAVSKALGTGIAVGVSLVDIEVVKEEITGRPMIRLHGGAARHYAALGGTDISISLSHEQDLALAFCVILCSGSDPAVEGAGR